jgi:probable HAF family extracellular repeat protein
MISSARTPASITALTALLLGGCADPLRPSSEQLDALAPTAAYVAGSYRLIDLGTLPGGAFSRAYGINNPARGATFGTVIGDSDRCTDGNQWCDHSGYRWTQARGMEELPHYAAGLWTQPRAINDRNEIVGIMAANDPVNPSVSWHAAKWTTSLNVPPPAATDLGILAGDSIAAAVAINNDGVSIGFSQSPDFRGTAVYWPKGSTTPRAAPVTDLFASALNDRNEVVGVQLVNGGQHAVYYDAATRTLIDIQSGWGFGGTQSAAVAISNKAKGANFVVGWAETASGEQHAFIWTAPAGPMVDLGTPTGTGNSNATGVNVNGQVVGASTDCGAVRWSVVNGSVTTVVLGSIPTPNSCTPGSGASGINDVGQIVGSSPATNAPDAPRRATLWY